MFFKVIREGFFILLVLYLTITLFKNWSNYSSCLAPTHAFLLTTYPLILISRATGMFLRKNRTVFLHKVFYPVLGLVILQGIVFQILNQTYTPTCGPKLGHGQVYGSLLLLSMANSGPLVTVLGDLLLVGLFKIFESRVENVIREVNTMMVAQEIVLPNGYRSEAKGYRGLSMEEITKIQNIMMVKEIDLDKFMQEMCSVCYEEFKKGDDMCVLPKCNHIFHLHCVKEWLVKSPVCPMCRANVRLNLEVEECGVPKSITQV